MFLSVTVCAVLVVRTGWLPKARLAGERLTGVAPPGKKNDACGLTVALSVRVTAAA
jgi:hypothetical protein